MIYIRPDVSSVDFDAWAPGYVRPLNGAVDFSLQGGVPDPVDVEITGQFPALTATVSIVSLDAALVVTGQFPQLTAQVRADSGGVVLLFAKPQSDSTDLVFAAGGDDSADLVALAITGKFPALTAQAAFGRVDSVQITGVFPSLTLQAVVEYDNRVTRWLGKSVAAPHQRAVPDEVHADMPWRVSVQKRDAVQSGWQVAQQAEAVVAVAMQPAAHRRQAVQARWQLAEQQHRQASMAHQAAVQRDTRRAGGWQQGDRRSVQSAVPLQMGIFRALSRVAPWKTAVPQVRDLSALIGASAYRIGVQATAIPWQMATHARNGRSVLPVAPVSMPCYVRSPNLLFDAPWSSSAALVFSCEHQASVLVARIVIPILRTYVTINSISLHRVDTGAELHAHRFTMSLDADSWTWSWSASLHHDAKNHLGRDAQGDPAELAVVVNGIPFRLRLGAVSRDRRFSPTLWAVSGSGKASILGAPYAPRMSFGNATPRNAQQLMADVLTINGASLGWTVDWGLTDWPVPGNVWTHQGTYISAILDIAGAAKGYVQPHATDAVLRVLPRYPAAPWAWDSVTPDFEIPADAAEVEGTQYVDKPAYNRVFVGGVGAGVFGPFKRAGTAGDMLAPQVNHALITHADAHRQRGLAELSDTGRQEHITLKMQVLPETGIITPGQFVRYLGDSPVMGIVRSTSIDWSRPVLRQTLRLETHA